MYLLICEKPQKENVILFQSKRKFKFTRPHHHENDEANPRKMAPLNKKQTMKNFEENRKCVEWQNKKQMI